MPVVAWEAVTRAYGTKLALDGVTLSIGEGEVLGILGPSGSGKSTLLRLTAGLETLTSGRITSAGRDITGSPPHARGFGLMFQDYCLFPHMNVARNVGFGLRMKKWSRVKREERTRQMLTLVRMEELAERSVLGLSGGEQQRVALARSLAPSPRLLMLDEPLGALDAALRAELLIELRRILRAVGATAVYVTHDHGEAMAVSSRVAIVNAGRVEQVGEPAQLMRRPASDFVATFLGLGALVDGVPRRHGGLWVIQTELGDIPVGDDVRFHARQPHPAAWRLLVRPSAVRFAAGAGLHRVAARIAGRVVRPSGVSVRVALKGRRGTEYWLECFLPGGDERGDSPRLSDGARSVWIDPRGCLPLASA